MGARNDRFLKGVMPFPPELRLLCLNTSLPAATTKKLSELSWKSGSTVADLARCFPHFTRIKNGSNTATPVHVQGRTPAAQDGYELDPAEVLEFAGGYDVADLQFQNKDATNPVTLKILILGEIEE